MKLFILLAIIAFATSFPLLGGYESLNIQDARSDPQIQSLIDAGLQKAVEKGLQDGKFSSPNFELYKINSIYKQQGDNGDNYKFDCEYINDEGDTMDAYFEASYNADNNDITVTDYSYEVKDYSVIDEIEQLYTQVTYDQFQYSNEIQNIVISGANQFIKYCIEAQTIPNTQYQVSEVNWVYRQVYENSYFYKCNLYIVGRQGNRAEANFTVYYQPLLNKYHLVDYSCIYEDNQAYVVRETVKPIDSYYTPITNIEKNSGTVKDVLNYGCEQVTRIASNDGKIPNTQLEVLDFTQANSQIVGNGVYYKFNCKLGDYNGVTLTTWFTVYYDFYASESSLISYSYESDIAGNLNQDQETEVSELNEAEFINVPENEEQIPQEEEAEEEESQTPGRLSIFDQVFPLPEPGAEEENEVAVENDQEQVTETEEPGSQSGNQGDIGDEEEEQVTQEEVIIEEIPPSEGQGDWEGYEELSTNQILYDSETTQVLQYGFDTVLESGQNEGKIPKYQFTITKIERAGKKKQEEGDFYKFKCEADSEEGTVLSLSFTAYYAFNTQEVSMIGYSYEIKNVVPITEVKETIPTDGEYEQYDQGEIKDDDRLQGALDYGIAQIYSYVIQEKKISTSDFSLNEVVSAYKQETVTGWCYKCEVKLEDTSNTYIYANFTVYYASDSGQYALSDYSYNVEESQDSGTEEGGSGGNDLYENIDAGAWEYDEYYNDMLLYAINEVIQKGYQSEEIPQSEYKISKIISAEKKQQNDDNYYRCTIELKNTEQVVITLEFTASITITTRSKKLWDWSYGVDNRQTATRTSDLKISDATYTEVDRDYIQYDKKIQDCIIYGADQVIPNPQDYSLLKVRNVYRQVLDNSVYYKYEIDLESKEKNAEFTCTVSYKPYLDNKDVVAYSYKTKPPYSSSDSNPQPDWWGSASWSSSPSGSGSAWSTNYYSIYSYNYQEMGVSDVKGNSKYQEILDYGVKECVEDLYEKKVLENKDYEVDEIVDAYKQEYNNYENCQMGVKLKNKYGAILELNFNVQYESRYEDKTVTSYSAKGYNSDGSEAVIVNYNGEQGGQYEIENCKRVYNEEIETVPYLKDIVDYGVGEVVDKATDKEDIYYKDFEVKEVKNMYRDMADSNKYRVYASLENSEGKKIDCSFCVSYQPKDEKKEVVWYSYITY